MNGVLYRQYLTEYIREAIKYSDGTNAGIAQYLSGLNPGGRFARNKEEKSRALKDAKAAFDEHRHWPLSIVLSHLGVELEP
jgi:hypothetical protein